MIIPFNTGNISGGSAKGYLAILIVFDFLLLIAFGVLYHKFLNDTYKGTFWDYSWDEQYFWNKSNYHDDTPFAFLCFWGSVFMINGLALLIALAEFVRIKILKDH